MINLKIKINFTIYIKKLQYNIKEFLFRRLLMNGYLNSVQKIQNKNSEPKKNKICINPQKFLKTVKLNSYDNLCNEGLPVLIKKK